MAAMSINDVCGTGSIKVSSTALGALAAQGGATLARPDSKPRWGDPAQGSAAWQTISTFQRGSASAACTVARGGVWSAGTQASQAAFMPV